MARSRKALEQTFTFRNTHEIPQSLPPPPASWAAPYARMAKDDDLPWRSLDEVTVAAKTFLDPLLEGGHVQAWDPRSWTWRNRRS